MKRLLLFIVLSFFTITALDHVESDASLQWLEPNTHHNIENPGDELHDKTRHAFVNVASYRLSSYHQSKFVYGLSVANKLHSQRNVTTASLLTLAGNRFFFGSSVHLPLIFPFHHFW